jgi:2-keto-4-pentenoate hydratase/2-oxohepta-3-ene-1,7-dioic acid hydratase in catechol pathway
LARIGFSLGVTSSEIEAETMRLISYRTASGAEALGVVEGTSWIAASSLSRDAPATMEALLNSGATGLERLRVAAAAGDIARRAISLDDVEVLAPVVRPGKVVAIGRNYADHATEEGVRPPVAPLIFSKWPSSVIGPGAEIRWDPDLAAQVDYEAELAVVIGRTARRVSTTDALTYVLGYTCLNDVSARDLQFGDGQWTRGKSLDTFCPMGPSLVTADEVGNPQALTISCQVGGRTLQKATTADMFFSVAEIISYCSQAFRLDPGDVIATGTPGGVGIFRDPPILLGDGDEVAVEIDRIGRLVNTCRFEPRRPDHGASGGILAQ